MTRDPRHTRKWRTLRALVLANQPYCQMGLRGCTRLATTVDHIVPFDVAPELAFAVHNLRSTCPHCNSSAGASHGNRKRAKGVRRWAL
jgi:5-methylcytosine-specific restriction endonuclease McrA